MIIVYSLLCTLLQPVWRHLGFLFIAHIGSDSACKKNIFWVRLTLPPIFPLSFAFLSHYPKSTMGESKPDYAVVIDQEPENNQSQQNTVVAPSGFKLSPGTRAVLPIASYCFASILMTVTNKYVLSGYDFNMNFLLLTIQVSCNIWVNYVQCISCFMVRIWSLFCYCNHSSFSTLSSSVILIKMRLANGCPSLPRSSL